MVGGGGDLVGEGLVASLARPGGNVTGFTNIDPDLSAKRLQLLREIFPKVSRVAVLYHGGPGGDQDELRETQTAAKSFGVQIQPLHVLEPDQFQRAYAAMTKERAQALITFQGSFTLFHQREILDLAAKIRIPTMCGNPSGLRLVVSISYGHDRRDQFRRAAVYVDKILKGHKASRHARRATEEVRVCHQSQNGQADRPNDSTECAGAGGQGAQVRRGECQVSSGWKQRKNI